MRYGGNRSGTISSLGSVFFFQAEDGIRATSVTGVQTCALPIFGRRGCDLSAARRLFSFDQFFSPTEQPAGGGEVAPATPEPPARSSGGRLRPPLEDEGDLDQFQAWLRGLKS